MRCSVVPARGQRRGREAGGDDGVLVYDVRGLKNGTKVHVRAVPYNAGGPGLAAHEYPIDVSDEPLLPPDGLRLQLDTDRVTLT